MAGHTLAAADIGGIADQVAAYTVQDAITALSGARPIGWKLGATSAASQAALGLDGPFYGPLLAPFCVANGATVAGASAFGPGAEGEFALTLGTDLPPRAVPYSEAEVADAVASVSPALEIAGTRLAGGLIGADPRHLIADGAANIAFLHGDPDGAWRARDLARHSVTVFVNGEEKASGTGAQALGGPLTALTWFANTLSQQGRGLVAGEIVTTGTCTGFFPLKSGDVVRADFGALGTVSATIT
ncbi:MAG: fumarylacetoacetate hydrolase family protein [Alphaproteobacteria bacterium]